MGRGDSVTGRSDCAGDRSHGPRLGYRPAAMRVGVAKEIKPREYRVALTPAGALELRARGHEVIVETGAGEGSGFPDEAYARGRGADRVGGRRLGASPSSCSR